MDAGLGNCIHTIMPSSRGLMACDAIVLSLQFNQQHQVQVRVATWGLSGVEHHCLVPFLAEASGNSGTSFSSGLPVHPVISILLKNARCLEITGLVGSDSLLLVASCDYSAQYFRHFQGFSLQGF